MTRFESCGDCLMCQKLTSSSVDKSLREIFFLRARSRERERREEKTKGKKTPHLSALLLRNNTHRDAIKKSDAPQRVVCVYYSNTYHSHTVALAGGDLKNREKRKF